MNDENQNNELDIEELLDEARSTPRSPEASWAIAARIATLILRGLPGSRVTAGTQGRLTSTTDYITPLPNPPMAVFGPDGGFIVRFLPDGSWIDSRGKQGDTRNYIEGSYETIAKHLIEYAGLGSQDRWPRPRRPVASLNPIEDSLQRFMNPTPTHTWRDDYNYPRLPKWGTEPPPSMCLQAPDTRVILTTYDQASCTYTPDYSGNSRWGVETLRIPAIRDTALQDGQLAAPEHIHAGDCLVTMGPKVGTVADGIRALTNTYIWHPQRVLHVENEGAGHLRVWLIFDHDVASEWAEPGDFSRTFTSRNPDPRILTGSDRALLLAFFGLNVFCTNCGSRATPIVYGLPGSDEPPYIALGGCIVEAGQPNYICTCGHEWVDTFDSITEGNRP